MNSDIVEQLRDRACPAGLPHTGNDPQSDHGHTDCWLHHQAADEIERVRNLITEWADADDDWTDVSAGDGPERSAYAAAHDALRRIERLRNLITEWADAEHADENLSGSWERLLAAENALRKAVGR